MTNTIINLRQKMLVPVHMDALVINQNTSVWKDLSLHIDSLGKHRFPSTKGLGYYFERGILQKGNDSIHPNGIHLHWLLPDALRHGEVNSKTNSIEFPLAPNRWMVVRTSNLLQMKAWVVESDYIDTKATNNFNWIQQKITASGALSNIKPMKLGRAVEFEKWTEKKKDALFLTAVAPGNPDFAASYMHCKNVFGFYDDMKDVAEGTVVSYAVYGWYSDAKANLLAGITNNKDFCKWINDWGWSLANKPTPLTLENYPDEAERPDSMIFHAMVGNVSWRKNNGDSIPSINDIQVAVGNSSSEALASMLRNRTGGDELSFPGKFLSAFQYKSLSDYGLKDDGLDHLKSKIHDNGFHPVKGGTLWLVEQKEMPAPGSAEEATLKHEFPFNPVVSRLLSELNNLQNIYEARINTLISKQENLYALVYKKAFALSADNGLGKFEKAAVAGVITPLNTDISVIRKEIAQLKKEISAIKGKKVLPKGTEATWPEAFTGSLADKYNALQKALSDPGNNMQSYCIKEMPGQRFYQPSEPAVVINGLNPSSKYVDKKGIVCRVKKDLATVIKVTTSDNSFFSYLANQLIDCSANRDAIVALNKRAASKLPGEIALLMNENFLLNPFIVYVLATCIQNQKGGAMNDEDYALLIQTMGESISTESGMVSYFSDKQNKLPAILPQDLSVASWKQPWVPLYLEWAVQWKSSYASISKDDITLAGWTFGSNGNYADYVFNQADQEKNTNTPVLYYGRTILAHDLVNKVTELNEKLRSSTGGGDLFQNLRPMGQQLSGLNSQLLMRYHGVVLPVLNNDYTPDKIYLEIGDNYSWNPMVNSTSFFPVRSGSFKPAMLRVVDSFGQVLQIMPVEDEDGNNITPTEKDNRFTHSVGLVSASDADAGYFSLAPRLLQPARLKFEWLSAHHTNRLTSSDPATSPVSGWLLHNKMDDSISVFDFEGVELGEIYERHNKIESTITVSVNNAELKAVIDFIKDKNGKNFHELLLQMQAVNDKAATKSSRQQLTMAVPVGFPIAVVSAQCTLELKKPPALSQAWNNKDQNDVSGLQYPLCIGNGNSTQDGLVAYFLSTDLVSARLPFLAVNNGDAFIQDENPVIQVGKTIQFTFLMDPRMPVHINTGILPAASYELPNHTIAAAIKAINLKFFTAPVLTPVSATTMPLLKSGDISWEWLSYKKETNLVQSIQVDDNTTGGLQFEPMHMVEGWLKLNTKPADSNEK